VDEGTTELLLESANFEPFGILKTSERLGLRSEGSSRWEKGVDPHLAPQAATYATELFAELAGAEWVGEVDISADLPARTVVHFRPERADALNGLSVAPDDQRTVLERLGFDVDGDWNVTVPTWRARDVTREIDLVEEVARTVLDQVPHTLPFRREMFGRLTADQRLRRTVEDVLVGAGLDEVYTPSLVSETTDGAWLPVPLTSELGALRTALWWSVAQAAQYNVDVGNSDIGLFEIARVYSLAPDESWHVAAVAEGGFDRMKGVLEALYGALHVELSVQRTQLPHLHPGGAAVTGDGGWLGELHPSIMEGRWSAFELDLAPLFAGVPEVITYEDVVTYPAVLQDLAFVVPEEAQAGDLVDAAHEAAGPELRDMRAFDVYRGPQVGEGRKSIAFRVSFQSPERTLSDDDAATLRARIAEELEKQFGAELRSG
jgi:phenylalanyl-tRNA synthetase beta chain